jgi:HK97 family phage prohead protease
MSRLRQRQSNLTPDLSIKDSRRLTFYAAIFDTPAEVVDYMPGTSQRTRYVETILPGSFRDSLKAGARVVANISHNDAATFASTDDGSLILQEDPRGLFCSCWIPETPAGDGIIQGVGNGLYCGASFKGTFGERVTGDSAVEVYSVALDDVCITSTPAHPATEGNVHLRTRPDRTQQLFALLNFLKIKLRIAK